MPKTEREIYSERKSTHRNNSTKEIVFINNVDEDKKMEAHKKKKSNLIICNWNIST